MNAQPFNIGELIKEGWRLTKENLGFLIGYQIIIWAIMLLFSTFSDEGLGGSIWHFIGWITLTIAKMGFYNSALLITGGIKPSLDQLYQNWRMLLSWIIASFLFGLMLFLGFALLIIPGFYLWARYGFYPFALLDKHLGPIEALKQSAKITEGKRWHIFLLILACIGLNLLGLLFFGVGLFITVPVTLLALTIAYRKLNLEEHQVINIE